ncbi:MAG: hypothetical protein ACREMN_06565 [Gemmatimonadales bacterium]
MESLESVDLPKTAAAWKSGADEVDIEDALVEDLQAETTALLEHAYVQAWTDDEEVEVLTLRVEEQSLHATFAINFVEVVPSSCRDLPHHKDGRVELSLRLERDENAALLGDPLGNPEEWDLWESAAS